MKLSLISYGCPSDHKKNFIRFTTTFREYSAHTWMWSSLESIAFPVMEPLNSSEYACVKEQDSYRILYALQTTFRFRALQRGMFR
jgi:hypothetical protein